MLHDTIGMQRRPYMDTRVLSLDQQIQYVAVVAHGISTMNARNAWTLEDLTLCLSNFGIIPIPTVNYLFR